MNRTKIEWCQNPDGSEGYTWNPITGCLHDCRYCWARGLANGRLKSRMLDNTAIGALGGRFKTPGEAYADPFYPRLWPSRINELWRLTHKMAARGIFVCSMGDLFGDAVPENWIRDILWGIRSRPHHRFYLLTKQPQNLAKWSPFPDNCWVGVSATNMRMLADACYELKRVEAKVKYISLEPFLDYTRTQDLLAWNLRTALVEAGINWVIIGAQTKPTILPEAEWVEEIIAAADEAGIPVFLKDSLKPLIGVYPEIVYPKGVKVTLPGTLRQEMPK